MRHRRSRWAALLLGGIFVLATGLSTGSAQQLPAAGECPATVRVEQEVQTYTKQLLAKVLLRAEQAEQALAAAKQDAIRMEDELTRVRQAWDDLKSKYAPPSN